MRIILIIFLALIFISCGDSKKKQETTDIKPVDTIKKESGNIQNNLNSQKSKSTYDSNQMKPPSLVQYHTTTLKNPYRYNLILTSNGKLLAKIPPAGKAPVTLANQKNVEYRVLNDTAIIPTTENKKPQITMTKIATLNEDASLNQIQSSVDYRIEILDDFPEQLDIKFSGPVIIKQVGKTTYDVTLDLLKSESAFNDWAKFREQPYQVTFSVNIKDKICPYHKVKESGDFIFSKW